MARPVTGRAVKSIDDLDNEQHRGSIKVVKLLDSVSGGVGADIVSPPENIAVYNQIAIYAKTNGNCTVYVQSSIDDEEDPDNATNFFDVLEQWTDTADLHVVNATSSSWPIMVDTPSTLLRVVVHCTAAATVDVWMAART